MSRFQVGLGNASDDMRAFESTLEAGDQYLAAGDNTSAIQAYKAGGQAAATTLGPEIDAQTQNASQSLTHQAWIVNGQLQAIAGTSKIDAIGAQAFAKRMYLLYGDAFNTSPAPPPSFPTPIETTANALLAYLAKNGCTQQPFKECGDFQTQFNAGGGQPPLDVDQKYGTETADALQAVLNMLGTSQTAPASCFASNAPIVKETFPKPAPSTSNAGLWLIGGAVVVAGSLVGYAWWRKRKARR